MNNFEKVKKHYLDGFWSKEMVLTAVEQGWITEEEYKEIVGEED